MTFPSMKRKGTAIAVLFSNKERPPVGGRCFGLTAGAVTRYGRTRHAELGVIPVQPSGKTKGKCITPDGGPE